MRDLIAELEYISENPSITQLMELLEEAIERAIKAEAELAEYTIMPDTATSVYSLRQGLKHAREQNARLTEENDIQRSSIQELSGQVMAYRGLLQELFDDAPDIVYTHEIEDTQRKIYELLSSSNPGEKYKENISKIQAAISKVISTADRGIRQGYNGPVADNYYVVDAMALDGLKALLKEASK